jgi:hypothetical protein
VKVLVWTRDRVVCGGALPGALDCLQGPHPAPGSAESGGRHLDLGRNQVANQPATPPPLLPVPDHLPPLCQWPCDPRAFVVGVRVQLKDEVPSVIGVGEAIKVPVTLECMQPFQDPPALQVSFLSVPGTGHAYPLRLPVAVASFVEDVAMGPSDFEGRWMMLTGEVRLCRHTSRCVCVGGVGVVVVCVCGGGVALVGGGREVLPPLAPLRMLGATLPPFTPRHWPPWRILLPVVCGLSCRNQPRERAFSVPSVGPVSAEGARLLLASLRCQARPDAATLPGRFAGSFRTATLSKTGEGRISVGILAQAVPNSMVRGTYPHLVPLATAAFPPRVFGRVPSSRIRFFVFVCAFWPFDAPPTAQTNSYDVVVRSQHGDVTSALVRLLTA